MRVPNFAGIFTLVRQNRKQERNVFQVAQNQAEKYGFKVAQLPSPPDQLILGTLSHQNDQRLKTAFKARGMEFQYSPKEPKLGAMTLLTRLQQLEHQLRLRRFFIPE